MCERRVNGGSLGAGRRPPCFTGTTSSTSRMSTTASLSWRRCWRRRRAERVHVGGYLRDGPCPRSREEARRPAIGSRSEEHTSELQSPCKLVRPPLLVKKKLVSVASTS